MQHFCIIILYKCISIFGFRPPPQASRASRNRWNFNICVICVYFFKIFECLSKRKKPTLYRLINIDIKGFWVVLVCSLTCVCSLLIWSVPCLVWLSVSFPIIWRPLLLSCSCSVCLVFRFCDQPVPTNIWESSASIGRFPQNRPVPAKVV